MSWRFTSAASILIYVGNYTMNYNQALGRLINHAGLINKDVSEDSTYDGGLDGALADLEFSGTQVSWTQFSNEIFNCLEVVNCQLNSDSPEKVAYNDKAKALDRDLVLAVQRLLFSLQNIMLASGIDSSQKTKAKRFHYQISSLWTSILEGGDFADIKEEAENFALTFDAMNENN